jgi:hypothetical protein
MFFCQSTSCISFLIVLASCRGETEPVSNNARGSADIVAPSVTQIRDTKIPTESDLKGPHPETLEDIRSSSTRAAHEDSIHSTNNVLDALKAPSGRDGEVPEATQPDHPSLTECSAFAGDWQFTTTVTSAYKQSAIGVNGFYDLKIDGSCKASLAKTGFKGQQLFMFEPHRVQRGEGRLMPVDDGWVLDLALMRDGKVDLTMKFKLLFFKGLYGSWEYTSRSFEVAGFKGSLSGERR